MQLGNKTARVGYGETCFKAHKKKKKKKREILKWKSLEHRYICRLN